MLKELIKCIIMFTLLLLLSIILMCYGCNNFVTYANSQSPENQLACEYEASKYYDRVKDKEKWFDLYYQCVINKGVIKK